MTYKIWKDGRKVKMAELFLGKMGEPCLCFGVSCLAPRLANAPFVESRTDDPKPDESDATRPTPVQEHCRDAEKLPKLYWPILNRLSGSSGLCGSMFSVLRSLGEHKARFELAILS